MIYKHIYNNEKKSTKYNGIQLNSISVNEFEKNDELTSIGYLKPLKKNETPAASTKILEVEGNDISFKIVNKKPLLHKVMCYTNVIDENNNNLYVAISKLDLIPLLMWPIIITMLIGLSMYTTKTPNNDNNEEITTNSDGLVDEIPVDNNKPDELLKPGQLLVPGYTNLYVKKSYNAETLNSKEVVYLNNPKGNKSTFVYVIKLAGTDEILFTSDSIPNGKADLWKPELEVGTYKVDFYIYTTKQDGSKGTTPYLPNINLEIYE